MQLIRLILFSFFLTACPATKQTVPDDDEVGCGWGNPCQSASKQCVDGKCVDIWEHEGGESSGDADPADDTESKKEANEP